MTETQNGIGNDQDRLADEGKGRSNTIKSLTTEKGEKETEQRQVTTAYHEYAPLMGLVLIYIALVFFLATSTLTWSTFWLSLIGFLALFGATGCFIWAIYSKSYEKRLRTRIEDLDFEIELANYPTTSDDEQRSERLFRRSEREVNKYYNLNLTENRILLYVGVLCIFVGLLIVAFTLAMVFSGGATTNNLDVWTKGIVAVVGAVSGIMINYVGAIYLKMYAQSVEAFGQLHGRLVRTHELFLANMLVTRIAKEEAPLDKGIGRQALLGELAKAIAVGAVKVAT